MSSDERSLIAAGYIVGDTTNYITDFLTFSLAKEDHDPGVYYFAIVAAACHLESVLEDFTYSWCKTKSNSEEPFLNRLMDKIGDDVNRATGLERWRSWLKVLFDIDFAATVGKDWQTLNNLFVLRNQLAHGRTTKFTYFHNANNGRFMGMTIEGSSYQQPFKHLLAAGVIAIPSGEVPSAAHLFTHKVALHFATSVELAIEALSREPVLSSLHPSAAGTKPNKSVNPSG